MFKYGSTEGAFHVLLAIWEVLPWLGEPTMYYQRSQVRSFLLVLGLRVSWGVGSWDLTLHLEVEQRCLCSFDEQHQPAIKLPNSREFTSLKGSGK